MKKIIALVLLWVILLLEQSFAANENKYYVADSQESCGETFYTCEDWFQHFDDENGCGCKKVEKKCTQGFNPVCGKIEFSCPEWALCQPSLPTTYMNSCVMDASDGYFLYTWACKVNSQIPSTEEVRIDNILESFFEKLDAQWYSNEKISRIISVILNRLGDIQIQMPHKWNIAYYVWTKLQEYKKSYDEIAEETSYYVALWEKCYVINYFCEEW